MLTPTHWNTLRALMNRVIPSDDFPNAWEAGIGDYLAHQFERDLQSHLEMYRLGLETLETEALSVTGKGFGELDASAQDSILSHVESGQVKALWSVDSVSFFRTVTEHIMEGYYSDPGNGGNRNSISWQMIGFERHE